MKVEIFHVRHGQRVVGPTLDLQAVSDEDACRLALIHTSKDSLAAIQSDQTAPKSGDLFCVSDPEDEKPPRCYVLSLDESNDQR